MVCGEVLGKRINLKEIEGKGKEHFNLTFRMRTSYYSRSLLLLLPGLEPGHTLCCNLRAINTPKTLPAACPITIISEQKR